MLMGQHVKQQLLVALQPISLVLLVQLILKHAWPPMLIFMGQMLEAIGTHNMINCMGVGPRQMRSTTSSIKVSG